MTDTSLWKKGGDREAVEGSISQIVQDGRSLSHSLAGDRLCQLPFAKGA